MRVMVVGAGVGGLCAAARLAAAGVETTLVDGADAVGGKLRTLRVGEVDVPAGPTVLTMPWVFEELFADLGATWSIERAGDRLEPIARHAFADGTWLDLDGDLDADEDRIGRLAGRREATGYRAFRAYARRIYDAVLGPFLLRPPSGLREWLAFDRWSELAHARHADAFRTMDAALADFFTDPRLRALFGRYATYVGSSPFAAPATLNVVAHVELCFGTSALRGGLETLARDIHERFTALGGRTQLGTRVDRIVVEGRRVNAVVLSDGSRHPCDAVVWNGEADDLDDHLSHPSRDRRPALEWASSPRSLSALLLLAAADRQGPLAYHTVVFPRQYAEEHRDLFGRRRLPSDPTVYICAPDRTGTPSSHERLLILTNAPAGIEVDTAEEARCRTRIDTTLMRAGIELGKLRAERWVRPADFAARFPGTGGSIYGRATHGPWAPLTRPGNVHPRISGLYLVGGSTHPGPGLPMVALSAKIAVSRLLADRARGGSTWFRPRAATLGGTSTF